MIRKAAGADLDAVAGIYDEMHRAEEAGLVTVGWKRDVYPVRSTAEAALKRGDLFVLEEDGAVLGSGIINQIQPDAYGFAPWEHEEADDRVCVLHTLVISPGAGGAGRGRSFVRFYEAYALEHGCRELRIDTNERNLTARAMYRRLGYKETAVVPTVFNGIPGVRLVLLEKWLDREAAE